jgi:hypothetical protein
MTSLNVYQGFKPFNPSWKIGAKGSLVKLRTGMQGGQTSWVEQTVSRIFVIFIEFPAAACPCTGRHRLLLCTCAGCLE